MILDRLIYFVLGVGLASLLVNLQARRAFDESEVGFCVENRVETPSTVPHRVDAPPSHLPSVATPLRFAPNERGIDVRINGRNLFERRMNFDGTPVVDGWRVWLESQQTWIEGPGWRR